LVIPTAAVHLLSDGFFVSNPGYWSGDEVTLTCAGGLPLDAGNGAAACPDGHGVYAGGDWDLGANRSHVAGDQDAFYRSDDDAPFYLRDEDVGLLETASFYVYRDQLDRLSLYTSRDAALRGSKADRVPLFRVDFGGLLLAPYGSADYQNALLVCSSEIDQGDYRFSDIQDEVTLASICESAPAFQTPVAGTEDYDNADVSPRSEIDSPADRGIWNVQGQLSEWSLNLTAQEIDTTAVGERFGDSVKSLVTGGGQIDFLVARTNQTDQSGAPMADSTTLMQLLLLAEKGCKADAQFWMIDDQVDACGLLPGDLFYEAQLLVTSMAINTRATDIIAGSLNFVTVRDIRLKMGTN
jgi:hypothetical protein